MMVATKRKLAPPPKKIVVVTAAFPRTTSTLPTFTDAVVEKTTTASTIFYKVALTSPRLVDIVVGSIAAVKRPHPKTKETG